MKQIIRSILNILYKVGYSTVLNRGEIPNILNARGLLGEGIEVGVKQGQFSEYLLDHWRGKLLYSVDPWREFSRDVYFDSDNVGQEAQEKNYQITSERLFRFGERSKLLRMTSEEAALTIQDQQLDFAYLDARHDYGSVKQDIGLWYPKVKPGGIIAGHDYINRQIGDTIYGVKPAVDEFAAQNGLDVKVTIREPIYKSWMIIKPV